MAYLLYYANENEEFKQYFERKLESQKEVEIIIKKLYRHFKLGIPNLHMTRGNRSSSCGSHSITINIDYANWLTIAHEVGHALEYKKYSKGSHTKRHKRQMVKVLRYCERHNFFKEELQRRTAQKEVKPEPTKQEIKDKKIAKAKERIKKYEKKMKLYSNKLKRANRSLAMLQRAALDSGTNSDT